MQPLPLADPGAPDLRSPARFLLRVLRLQAWTVAGGVLFGVLWMSCQAVVPYVLGRAVDEGVAGRDGDALLRWALVLLAIGAVQAGAGVSRHRFAVSSFLIAYFRTTQWVAAQSVRLGADLRRLTSTGEVVSVGTTDTLAVARALDVTARGAGSVVAFALVAVLLLSSSVALGLVVLVGVPVFSLVIGPALKPLHRRQAVQRTDLGRLTTLGTDTVAGLRVLRGVGGEAAFVDRYRRESQRVRASGVQVARSQSLLDAAQVLVPGTFVVIVTWLAARSAVQGQISVGDLIAFYGYAAFLVTPLRTVTEAADKFSRALVAGRRMTALLSLAPSLGESLRPVEPPTPLSPLHDIRSGLVVRPGVLTAVVSADPAAASALADRLGRYVDAEVRWGGVRLADLPLEVVRARVHVVDQDVQLLSGRLRDELGPGDATAALHAACMADVLEAMSDGLDTALEERARQLSGGQRQRLVLARALTADPEVLVLDEPTSAVDAHTEARIADRLRELRAGRTTVVLTSSPLVLDRADEVALLVDGRVAAVGTHRELLSDDAYRATVLRTEVSA
ncbi:MAG: ABC transporter ATP-binding protein/permease [Frankiaceae bacterium]|nr:ABC transporter ATP-binding protein/permease [Frankiaceae bacterium]